MVIPSDWEGGKSKMHSKYFKEDAMDIKREINRDGVGKFGFLVFIFVLFFVFSPAAGVMSKTAIVDFDGDHKTDTAVYRSSSGAWWIKPSSTGSAYGVGFGGDPSDIPVPGDYDGDGKTDTAVYRSNNGAWWIKPSSGASAYGVGFAGDPSDIPLTVNPASYASSLPEATATVGPSGGTVEVTNTSSPLYGVKIEIPPMPFLRTLLSQSVKRRIVLPFRLRTEAKKL